MLYHIPDLEPNWRQKICLVAKGLKMITIYRKLSHLIYFNYPINEIAIIENFEDKFFDSL